MQTFLSRDGKFYMKDGKVLSYNVPITGYYVLNKTLTAWPTELDNAAIELSFTSGSTSYSKMVLAKDYSDNYCQLQYKTATDDIAIAAGLPSAWSDITKRIIKINDVIKRENDSIVFYDWLIENIIPYDGQSWKLKKSIGGISYVTYAASTDSTGKLLTSSNCIPNVTFSFKYNEIFNSGIETVGNYTRKRDRYGSASTGYHYIYYTILNMTLQTKNGQKLGSGSRTISQSTTSSTSNYPAGSPSCTITTSEPVLKLTTNPTSTALTWLFNNATPVKEEN